jgi:chemotaxis protein MotB
LATERRRRRNQETKKENNERWVISYADFMTLLLATFVVLYAVSSINVSRYRQAAEALSAVFTGRVIVPNRGSGAMPNGMFQNLPAPVPKPVVALNEPQKGVPNISEKVRKRIARLNDAYKNLTHLLQDVIDKGQVHIAHNGLSVVIDINASVLYDSGKADLTTSALGVIDQIGIVLKDAPYSIQVNGFTDDAPIHTAQFESNWELSAVRAISVVKRFVSDGVDPSRLVGAGYGEYHPVAANDSPDGRAKNRRVSIVVVSVDDSDEPKDPAAVTATAPAIGHAPLSAAPVAMPTTRPLPVNKAVAPPVPLAEVPAKAVAPPPLPAMPPIPAKPDLPMPLMPFLPKPTP